MTAKLQEWQKQYFIDLAETSLNDTCTLHQYTGESKNEYNDITPTYTDIEDVVCGFQPMGVPSQRENIQPVILQHDGQLRVKLTQQLSVKDQITVRGKRYSIDNVWDGLTVRLAALKKLGTAEDG